MYKKSTAAILLTAVILSVFMVLYFSKREQTFDTTHTSDLVLDLEYDDSSDAGILGTKTLKAKAIIINGLRMGILDARNERADVWRLRTANLGMIKLKTGSGKTAGQLQLSLTSAQRGKLATLIEHATRPSLVIKREIELLEKKKWNNYLDTQDLEREIEKVVAKRNPANELIIADLKKKLSTFEAERERMILKHSEKKKALRDALAMELHRKVGIREVERFLDE